MSNPARAPAGSVTAIVVTFQSEGYIQSSLRSLRNDVDQVIVVDNASTDYTLRMVEDHFSTVELLPLSENVGFATAVDQAAARARGEYLLLLNPDGALEPGALAALREFLERNPTVAAVGPRLQFPDGAAQDSAFRYPTLLMTWLEFFHRPARLLGTQLNGRLDSRDGRAVEVDHPLGACMLIRRSAWKEVGPFDSGFFLYCEEVDWCMRAKARGWSIAHVPWATALHHGGASAAHSPGASLLHLYESRGRLHHKHRGKTFVRLAAWITRLGLAHERDRLREGAATREDGAERIAALDLAIELSHW